MFEKVKEKINEGFENVVEWCEDHPYELGVIVATTGASIGTVVGIRLWQKIVLKPGLAGTYMAGVRTALNKDAAGENVQKVIDSIANYSSETFNANCLEIAEEHTKFIEKHVVF